MKFEHLVDKFVKFNDDSKNCVAAKVRYCILSFTNLRGRAEMSGKKEGSLKC